MRYIGLGLSICLPSHIVACMHLAPCLEYSLYCLLGSIIFGPPVMLHTQRETHTLVCTRSYTPIPYAHKHSYAHRHAFSCLLLFNNVSSTFPTLTCRCLLYMYWCLVSVFTVRHTVNLSHLLRALSLVCHASPLLLWVPCGHVHFVLSLLSVSAYQLTLSHAPLCDYDSAFSHFCSCLLCSQKPGGALLHLCSLFLLCLPLCCIASHLVPPDIIHMALL